MGEQDRELLERAALLCPANEIGSSAFLRVLNVLCQQRAEQMYQDALAASLSPI